MPRARSRVLALTALLLVVPLFASPAHAADVDPNLAAWARVVAAGGARDASVLVVGDSFAEGQGAPTRSERWIDRLSALLVQRDGFGASALFVPPWYAVYGVSDSWARPAQTDGTQDAGFGPGDRAVRLAPGQSAQWDVTGATTAEVVHAVGPGQGDIDVSVDGVHVTTLDAGTAATVRLTQRTPVALPPGAHSLLVSARANQVGIEGVVLGRPSTGSAGGTLTMWDGAHTGATSEEFAPGSYASDGWAGIRPDLVIDELVGSNDELAGKATAQEVADRLTARIARYRALDSHPTVVVLLPWQLQIGGTPNALGESQGAYLSAARAAAQAADADVIDLAALVPDVPPQYVDPDGVHATSVGQARIAELVDQSLATLVPAQPATPSAAATTAPATGAPAGDGASGPIGVARDHAAWLVVAAALAVGVVAAVVALRRRTVRARR